MYDLFTHFFISEKVGYSKPAHEYFDVCFAELNKLSRISKEEIMMIGDSLSADIAGAREFGLKTCFFNIKHKELSEVNTDYTVEYLDEIKNIL